ncbi:iron transporter [Cysteiniphilum halobium]|uniref:iron transporter n=1 Tax=Cysteiniphilum halobium TaxID=2219059 RepID=UPI003F839B12
MKINTSRLLLTLTTVSLLAQSVYADNPISGVKKIQGKIESDLIWVEPVTMEPNATTGIVAHGPKHNRQPDIHNELDQHELKGTKMGFGAGGWIPNCQVACVIVKGQKTPLADKNGNKPWFVVFSMMSMVANDGPHYGRNVALDGPGIYYETCQVNPPDWLGFFRHTDKASGVSPFFKPYEISGKFPFTGSGKAGGY